MRNLKTKNEQRSKNKYKSLITLVFIILVGIFVYSKYNKEILLLIQSKTSILKSPHLNKKSLLDKKFKWKYVKKKQTANQESRSIALVTSRNKFNDHEISLGLRCAKTSKKKALFLFGKFFKNRQPDGHVKVVLDYDNRTKVYKKRLKIVLKGKGLAFKDFRQLDNIQKFNRLKVNIITSKRKSKSFIFELAGSSKSINQVLSDCR